MKKQNHISEIQKTKAARNGERSRTTKTSLKSEPSKTGSNPKEMLQSLSSNISLAKGLLATLSSGQKSDWTRKLKTTDPEHLRILLQDVMDEIWNAETTLTTLSQMLEKK